MHEMQSTQGKQLARGPVKLKSRYAATLRKQRRSGLRNRGPTKQRRGPEQKDRGPAPGRERSDSESIGPEVGMMT
jgi:hypothetical protein